MRLIPIVSFAVACTIASVCGAPTRQPDVKAAALLGRQLYDQSARSETTLSPSFRRARQTAMAALPQIDRSKYRFEVVSNPSGPGFLVYALAYSKDPDEVVLGIHYRIAVAEDGTKVQSIDPLSRSALVVSKSKGIPKGATPGPFWATSLITPTPLEIYVYLSLLHHTPIFVGAPDHTIWKVDGSQISKVRNGR
jgi:hypothetical protein